MNKARLVTARELAELLQVSVETVWRYTRSEKIPYVQLANRKYRYEVEQVLCALGLSRATNQITQVREARGKYDKSKSYTYQDYLQIPEEEGYSYEVLDGVLVKEPAPTTLHQRVSRRLQRILEDHFWVSDPEGEVFDAPVDLTLSEMNVCQPDLVYIPSQLSQIVEEKRINGTPYLVVEVLSPSTRSKDRIRKRVIYERLGVPNYWIVDPVDRTIEAYALRDDVYLLRASACEDEVLTHPDFPGLTVELTKLWRQAGP